MLDSLDRDVCEAGGLQIAADLILIVVAVRRAGHETRRVVREDGGQCLRDHVGEFVVLNPVPDVEEKTAAVLQHAPRFRKTLDPVRKKHRAELAGDGVKTPVTERQRQRIGWLPRDPPVGKHFPGLRQHRLVQVGRRDAAVGGQLRRQCPGENPGARRRLQHPGRLRFCDAAGEVARIGLEDEGDHQPVVHFRNRSRKHLVGGDHDPTPCVRFGPTRLP